MNKHNPGISLNPGRLLGIRLVQQEIDSDQSRELLKKIRYSAKIGGKDGVKTNKM